MEIIKVDMINNIDFLKKFIENGAGNSPQFRYFQHRSIDVIKNHLITLIIINNKNPIAYGHLDKDKDIIWLGLCVDNMQQSKGYGKLLMSELLKYCFEKNIEKICLTVDIDNFKAINLYTQNGFKIIEKITNYYKMEWCAATNNILKLPVSYGEAIDKLTILDIKLKKISNKEKLIEVKKEFDILKNNLDSAGITNKNLFYYNKLMEINEIIWDKQDIFRESNDENVKNILCKEIIDYNDRRFRIKNKININSSSHLKEQKGYIPNKCVILTHHGLGDCINTIGMVRYFATIYDEVLLPTNAIYKKNLELFYSDEPNIKITIIPAQYMYNPDATKLYNGYTIIKSGFYVGKRPCVGQNIPFQFYIDANLSPNIMWSYFQMPDTGHELWELIKDIDYVFMHSEVRNGNLKNLFTEKLLIDRFGINPDITLIICANKNIYNKDHKFYDLASKFVMCPISHYKKILENSRLNVVTDSCFFCLALNLNLKYDNNYYKKRSATSYDYIFDTATKYGITKIKRFQQI